MACMQIANADALVLCSFTALKMYLCCRTALEETKELQKLRKRPKGVSIEDLATIKTKQKEQSVEVDLYLCHHRLTVAFSLIFFLKCVK